VREAPSKINSTALEEGPPEPETFRTYPVFSRQFVPPPTPPTNADDVREEFYPEDEIEETPERDLEEYELRVRQNSRWQRILAQSFIPLTLGGCGLIFGG